MDHKRAPVATIVHALWGIALVLVLSLTAGPEVDGLPKSAAHRSLDAAIEAVPYRAALGRDLGAVPQDAAGAGDSGGKAAVLPSRAGLAGQGAARGGVHREGGQWILAAAPDRGFAARAPPRA